MHQILLRVPLPGGGYFDIASYGAMLALGTIFGAVVAMSLGRRDGVAGDTVIDVVFWAVLGGIVGAKLWYVVQYWGDFPDKWDLLRSFRSGLVYYGGLIGGVVCVVGYVRHKRLGLLKILDVCAPAAALGLAFGRLGCFLNGCCYGRVTQSPFGVRFPADSLPFEEQLSSGLVTQADRLSRPVLPSQLFAVAGAISVFVVLLTLRRTRRFYGEQIALLFVAYSVVRFAEEFSRGDHSPALLGMTAAQVSSIVIFAAGGLLLTYLRTRRPAGMAVAAPAKKR